MVVIECEFYGMLWQDIWDRVKNYLNKPAPQLLQRIRDINIDLKDALDFYSMAETHALGEFPNIYVDHMDRFQNPLLIFCQTTSLSRCFRTTKSR